MNLFSADENLADQPLAARMRPRTLEEFVGQDHIIGRGRLLRRAIQADQLSSLIFYGPPGSGKTTLARIIANTTQSAFVTLNAVLTGVKDIREQIKNAGERKNLYGKRTILFVDEVHRWNKAQQDALLPWVENGTVILIGATTENPYFEVNSALVSRSRIFQLKTLNDEDLHIIARNVLKCPERGYGSYNVIFEDGALEHLVSMAAGDARSLLNAIELAVETTPETFPPSQEETIRISLEAAEESIQKKVVLYDKEGDYHFDTISAFIKSLRGSDPDAALYWLARMVSAGEDPKFILRRMLILAGEDIGMADPNALTVTASAAAAFDRVGLPEGQFHLAQAALYLATAPKSNSALGYFDALKAVESEKADDVPAHLKDSSRDKKGFGHGEGYLYPHAYKDHWVAQQYLPENLRGKIFYKPGSRGYEESIAVDVLRAREAQLEGVFEARDAEILTFSPTQTMKEEWIERALRDQGKYLSDIRNRIFGNSAVNRHDLVLIPEVGNGFLLWEALRRVPEGGVWAWASGENLGRIIHYAESLAEVERPRVVEGSFFTESAVQLLKNEGVKFELAAGRNCMTRAANKTDFFSQIADFLTEKGRISFAEVIPSRGTRLTDILQNRGFPSSMLSALQEAEKIIFSQKGNPLMSWDESSLLSDCIEAGLSKPDGELKEYQMNRYIKKSDIIGWLNNSGSREKGYGTVLPEILKEKELTEIKRLLLSFLADQEITWKRTVFFLTAEKQLFQS